MRRPDLRDLPPLPPLPSGMALRAAERDDTPALAVLLACAFEDDTWTPERVRKALLDAPDVPRTLLITEQGAAARFYATASVQLSADPGSTTGLLHWVGADTAFRGQGLGYILSLAVLHELAQIGRTDALLFTDDFRLPAIRIYRRLGFLPEITDASHPDRWARMEQAL